MASKSLQICFCILVVLSFLSDNNFVSATTISPSTYVISIPETQAPSSIPALFLKKLEGSRKGDSAEDINKVKKYLQRYGYISKSETQLNGGIGMGDVQTMSTGIMDGNPAYADKFDHSLESAIKKYQTNYNLPVTGVLDADTVKQMSIPRCGVADIINGESSMKSGISKTNRNGEGGHIHTVSHYTFFDNNLKWPASKFNLTYAFLPSFPTDAIPAVSRAFSKWAAKTQFTFALIKDHKVSDIKISFEKMDHGDGAPFEGVGGALAHAFAPTDGRLHFDVDEPWSVGPVPNYFDVETVALHEIGHLLGLQHSSLKTAIMFPSIPADATKDLTPDDIDGVKALYKI